MSIKSAHTQLAPISLRYCLLLSVVAIAGCVINFKSEKPPSKGIIHVDVHYVYPGKNEMSTSEKFYKKEIEAGRYAQTKLELNPGQQLLVLNKAFVLHFYQMPDTFTHKEAASGPPQFLRIWADTLDKTVYWSGSTEDLHPTKYHLEELIEYVDSIVRSTEDYQALPKSKLAGD